MLCCEANEADLQLKQAELPSLLASSYLSQCASALALRVCFCRITIPPRLQDFALSVSLILSACNNAISMMYQCKKRPMTAGSTSTDEGEQTGAQDLITLKGLRNLYTVTQSPEFASANYLKAVKSKPDLWRYENLVCMLSREAFEGKSFNA